MTTDSQDISIPIMGTTYQIKCPTDQVQSLKEAADYLEAQMRTIKSSSLDRVAVITALNIAHQFLTLQQQLHSLQQRLTDLHAKMDSKLSPRTQLEFVTSE